MNRPLGPLSDFVAEGLDGMNPDEALAQWRQFGGDINLLMIPTEQRALAALDLKMLEWTLVHSGILPPDDLVAAVDQMSTPGCSGLTYADIVLVNPPEDIRTFTQGEVGRSEAYFYSQHRLIEGSLTVAIACLAEARDATKLTKFDHALQLMRRVNNEHLGWLVGGTIGLGQGMSPAAFAVFRKFLNPHPIRKMKGPSGAFSGTIPTIDVEVAGGAETEYRKYLEDNRQYIPVADLPGLDGALQRAEECTTLCHLVSAAHEDRLNAALKSLLGSLRLWRARHYMAVGRQLPGALDNKVVGTGDEHAVGEFLRKRLRETRSQI